MPKSHFLTHDALIELLDVLGANVFAADRQGSFTFVNAAMAQALGCPREDMLRQGSAAFFDAACRPELEAHDRLVLEQGQAWEGEEVWRMAGRAEARTFWVVKKPLHDAAGAVDGLCCVASDITERKAVEAQMLEQRQLLHIVLNSLDAFVYMKDQSRHYRYINEKVAQNLGVRAEDVIGKLDSEVLPPGWADQFWALDRRVFETGQRVVGEETHVTPDGRRLVHWSIKVPVRYEGLPAMIGFSTDISEVVELREQLRVQAMTDALTGIANRGHFNELATKELSRARRHGLATALLLLDIDHFKRVNDGFGHLVGDAVLQRVAALLCEQVRAEDTPARVGGEEFAVLLPRTEPAAALALAERIRERVAADRGALPDGSGITLSVGVASCADGRLALEKLYAQADEQLYRAKQGGRNRVCMDC